MRSATGKRPGTADKKAIATRHAAFVTAPLDTANGARPSAGAAGRCLTDARQYFDAGVLADPAAPEDGRTPAWPRRVVAGAKSARLLAVSAAIVALWLAIPLCLPAKEKKTDQNSVPPPAFSPPGGLYTTNILVHLSSRSGSAVIRYTLDGLEPDGSSPVYSAPIPLSNSTLVRAKAFAKGATDSVVVAEAYTLLDSDLGDFSSNLPLVILNSFGTNLVHEWSVGGAVQIVDCGNSRARLANPAQLSRTCLLHIRGRASLRYPKNSFTLKITNGEGDAEAVSMLGMPSESDWVLYAPFPDKTLMRDVLAYELHGKMGHWSPRTRFVEVFVNKTGARLSQRDYVGVYVFEEKIKRDKNRVNIAKLKPDDNSEPRITGGYIFKKDHVGDVGLAITGDPLGGFPANTGSSSSSRPGFPTGPGGFPADPKGFQPTLRSGSRMVSSSSSVNRSVRSGSGVVTNVLGRPLRLDSASSMREIVYRGDDEDMVSPSEGNFRTSHTNQFFFVEPPADELTGVQRAWLKNHLNELEGALYGPEFRDPLHGYAAYLDVDSFIDYHLIVETTKNVDGFRFSVFFHKDRGGKIKADPIWDWNLSFGNANGKQGWLPEFWLWPQLDDKEYTWYRRLFEDPDFSQRYVDRWAQLRTNILATRTVLARVDEIAALLEESQKRNFERWPLLGRPVNPNYFVGSSYEEEVAWMKKYIQTRLVWMEKQFLPVPGLSLSPAQKNAGRRAELSAPSGEICFTLDGTDPRARGGATSQAAKIYDGPLQLNPGAKLFARTRWEGRWSGPTVFQAGD